MVSLQDIFVLNVTPPAVIVDDAALTTGEIDTVQNGVKYNYLTLILQLGAIDIAVVSASVKEGDVSGTVSDITGLVGGTDFTLPTSNSDNGIYLFQIDLRKRKRYIDLAITMGNGAAGTYASVLAVLSRGAQSPVGATAKGGAVEVIL